MAGMATRVMSWKAVIAACVEHFPEYRRQRANAITLDYWLGGAQGSIPAREENGIFVPNPYKETEEHRDLSERAYSPWAQLVVDTLAQTMFLDGVRLAGKQDNLEAYRAWQKNNWDDTQARVYRGALGHGLSFASSFPGKDRLTGEAMPKFTAYSAKRCAAWYDLDDDEWPLYVLVADPILDAEGNREGWSVRYIDEVATYFLTCKGEDGTDPRQWAPIEYEVHDQGVPPFVRYSNQLDLDGNSMGEIEPVIPILRRIDQDTYDRLIVQRYGAWKIRYITGLVKPKEMTDEDYRNGLMKLKIGDFLVSDNKDTKFGTLDETQLDGFVAARDADIRDLAAVKQIPPHHMLGTTPQMQPESLASINASLMARSLERRTSFGESHEKLFRLAAMQMGNRTEAQAYDLQVRWRDTETRSLSQTADALGKIAMQLKVPVEMLWERIEGWTDSDSVRAKELIEDGSIDQLLAEMEKNNMIDIAKATKPAPAGAR